MIYPNKNLIIQQQYCTMTNIIAYEQVEQESVSFKVKVTDKDNQRQRKHKPVCFRTINYINFIHWLISKFNPSQIKPAKQKWPCKVHWIKSSGETGAEIVLIAVQSIRARQRKPAITQIPRDRSWVPRAALAPFPSAPPTLLRAKQAPPAPLSSLKPSSSCQGLLMQ